MPHVRVNNAAGLHHLASGFHAWEPGEYEFPDNPGFAGWLQGQIERGAVTLLPLVTDTEAITERTETLAFAVDLRTGETIAPGVELPGELLQVPAGVSLPELPSLGNEPVTLGFATGPAVNDPDDRLPSIRCTGTKASGEPCGSFALEGSDRCRHHQRKEGAA